MSKWDKDDRSTAMGRAMYAHKHGVNIVEDPEDERPTGTEVARRKLVDGEIAERIRELGTEVDTSAEAVERVARIVDGMKLPSGFNGPALKDAARQLRALQAERDAAQRLVREYQDAFPPFDEIQVVDDIPPKPEGRVVLGVVEAEMPDPDWNDFNELKETFLPEGSIAVSRSGFDKAMRSAGLQPQTRDFVWHALGKGTEE